MLLAVIGNAATLLADARRLDETLMLISEMMVTWGLSWLRDASAVGGLCQGS